MPLRRLLHLFQRSRVSPIPDPEGGGLSAEIEALEYLLSSIRMELEAVEHAARTLRLDRIPVSLLGVGTQLIAAPASPGAQGAPSHPDAQQARLDHLRDLLALAGQERTYLRQVLTILRPPISWEMAGAQLKALCQKPFELSGFYLARADWVSGRIHFPYFYEAGRPNEAESIALDPSSGLTGWALFAGEPCYLDSGKACRAHGMRLTDVELRSGLHTQSWFGAQLPSADPARPLGLMAFHCYHAQAFPGDRQALMVRTARLTAMHLSAPPEGGNQRVAHPDSDGGDVNLSVKPREP